MLNLEAYGMVMWIGSIAFSSGRQRSHTVYSVAVGQMGMCCTVDLYMGSTYYACLHDFFEERWEENHQISSRNLVLLVSLPGFSRQEVVVEYSRSTS